MTKQQAQAQLDAICRKQYVKPQPPLTGLQKQALEESETARLWAELRGKQ